MGYHNIFTTIDSALTTSKQANDVCVTVRILSGGNTFSKEALINFFKKQLGEKQLNIDYEDDDQMEFITFLSGVSTGIIIYIQDCRKHEFIELNIYRQHVWQTGAQLGRLMSETFGVVVECDPGEDYPEVHPLSDTMLRIANGSEQLFTVCEEIISTVEMLESGKLLLILESGGQEEYMHVYGCSTRVCWDNEKKGFHSNEAPNELSYVDWFKHIAKIVEKELDVVLFFNEDTKWHNVPTDVKNEFLLKLEEYHY